MDPNNVGKLVDALTVALRPEFEALVQQYVLRHALIGASALVIGVVVGWTGVCIWLRREKDDTSNDWPGVALLVGGLIAALLFLVVVISVINCLTPELSVLQCLIRGGV